MYPFSLRNRLGETQFDVMSTAQYLDRLRVVADISAPPEKRRQAKEDLLNAHFRLIAKTIHSLAVGIEEPSDLFNSMAGHMYNELTEMAAAAAKTGTRLSSMIAHRVTTRLLDKIRNAKAGKRTAAFDSPERLDQVSAGESSDVLEGMLLDEAYAELRATIDELPETERLVCQALDYGFETEQDLTVSQIAWALGMPETTARSAFARAREKLQRRFPDMVSGKTS